MCDENTDPVLCNTVSLGGIVGEEIRENDDGSTSFILLSATPATGEGFPVRWHIISVSEPSLKEYVKEYVVPGKRLILKGSLFYIRQQQKPPACEVRAEEIEVINEVSDDKPNDLDVPPNQQQIC